MWRETIATLKEQAVALRQFIEKDFWRRDLASVPPLYRPALVGGRFFYLIFVDFSRKKTFMMASSLSYATVLGLIPLLVVLAALSTGFLRERVDLYAPKAIDYLIAKVTPVFNDAAVAGEAGKRLRGVLDDYVNTQLLPMLTKLDLKEIGVYGMLALIVVALSLTRVVEESFNDIWGVTTQRSYLRLLSRYWLMFALFPVVTLVAISLTGADVIKSVVALRESFGFWAMFAQQAANYITLWVLFAAVYKFIPNARVRLVPALIGGVVGGTLWQINSFLSFMFVSKALRTHYLYGSFGIVPIFLMTLYVGWLIVLFGAHVSFAAQNLELFRIRLLVRRLTVIEKQNIALTCLTIIAHCFRRQEKPPTANDISRLSGLPDVYCEGPLTGLIAAGYLVETSDRPPRFALAVPPDTVHVSDVLALTLGRSEETLNLGDANGLPKRIAAITDRFRQSYAPDTDRSLQELAELPDASERSG